MTIDVHDAARYLGKALSVAPANRLVAGRGRVTGVVRALVRDLAFRRLARRLADSASDERRALATALTAAIEAEDDAAALALVSTAGRRTDLRAEKIVSRRYRYVWLCIPKAASRSIIAGLRSVDPEAELIRGRTLDEVLEARPEARDYLRFAFLRHPCHRTCSFYADKHVHAQALGSRSAYRQIIEPYYGLRTGMGFEELCRWLDTPFGSDAFADRHWLSQSRQLAAADGRPPDFLGSHERLDADWRALCERLRMPFRRLPRLNARPEGVAAPVLPDEATAALLRRRYAEDFGLGGYADEGAGRRNGV